MLIIFVIYDNLTNFLIFPKFYIQLLLYNATKEKHNMNNDGLYSASLVTTVTSACISVGFITILGFLFDFVALKLTEWEIPKTEAEFQNRLSIKVLII